jgi:hypothetical protein
VAQYAVEDFYRNTEYFGGSFSPDGSRILVSSNLTGIFNAYALPVSGAPPETLTTSGTEAVIAQSYFRSDDRVLFSSDQGGNELTHLYVRDPDGRTEDLTPGENLKASFLGWAGDDRSFFVALNQRDPRFFDVLEIAAQGYARTPFIEQRTELGPISGTSGTRAIKIRTTADTDIYLHDRTRADYASLSYGSVNYPGLHPMNRFLTSDWTGSSLAGARSCLRSGYGARSGCGGVTIPSALIARPTRTRPPRYTTPPLAEEPPASPRIADEVFADDSASRSTPRTSHAERPLVGDMGKAPAGLTDALHPSMKREIWWRRSSPGLLPTTEWRSPPHRPRRRAPGAGAGLVLVHGGPGAAQGFSLCGWSTAATCLRHQPRSSGYGKTFFKMDDRNGRRTWATWLYKGMLTATGIVDPPASGSSKLRGYGAGRARPARGVSCGRGLFDLELGAPHQHPSPESFRQDLYEEMGDPTTDSERLHRISPYFNAARIKSPLMVLQGANDPRVLQVESDEIVAAARKNGVPVEYIVFPDEGHGFLKKENEIRGTTGILAFLDQHLRGAAAPPASDDSGGAARRGLGEARSAHLGPWARRPSA